MTIIEELRTQADEIAASPHGMIPYTPSGLLERAASEIVTLQNEIKHLNAEAENRRIKIFEISDQLIDANHTIRELRKQIAELTVKKNASVQSTQTLHRELFILRL